MVMVDLDQMLVYGLWDKVVHGNKDGNGDWMGQWVLGEESRLTRVSLGTARATGRFASA